MIGTRYLGLLAALVPLMAGCGEGGKYAVPGNGTVRRGEVHMKLASNGGVELMLPSPRWPDSVDMRGRGRFRGDTLVFKADTAASACRPVTPAMSLAVTKTSCTLRDWAWTIVVDGGRR